MNSQATNVHENEASTSPDLSVMVMCYNEAATLEPFVQELRGVLKRLPLSYEIVVIDDGSTDRTSALADELASDTPTIRVVHHRKNQGLGGVYRTGFQVARGRIGTFFPADGQFPASILIDFVALIDDYDLVLGYTTSPRPLLASALSRLERLFYRGLFGRLPRFQGVMMFRRTLLQRVDLQVIGRGWGVLMEFIIKSCRLPIRTISVPTPLRPRTTGKSKVLNLGAVAANLVEALSLRLQMWGLRRSASRAVSPA